MIHNDILKKSLLGLFTLGLTFSVAAQEMPTSAAEEETGAINTLIRKDFEHRGSSDAAAAIQGLIPSLDVSFASGVPFAGSVLSLRGMTSTGKALPLVLVDGVETSLDKVNPNDIESIQVLKDAAATAILGARGAAGVILVTTRRGRPTPSDKAEISFDFFTGLTSSTARADLSGLGAVSNGISHEELLLSDTRFTHSANLAVQGAREGLRYYVGGRYYGQDGPFKGGSDRTDNLSLTANFDARITSWLSYSLNADYIYRHEQTPWFMGETDLKNALGDVSKAEETAAAVTGGLSTEAGKEHYIVFKNLLEARLARSLTAGASFAFQHTFDFIQQRSSLLEGISEDAAPNIYEESRGSRKNNSAEGYIRWSPRLGGYHRLDAQAGAEWQSGKTRFVPVAVSNLVDPSISALTAGDGNFKVDESFGYFAQTGIYARGTYSYKGRYLAQATLRTDRSSRFAEGKDRAWSYAVSAGWVVSKEPFWDSLKETVNYLKIRASYGSIANQQLSGDYLYLQDIAKGKGAWLFTRSSAPTSASFGTAVNDGLSWETINTANFGLDATVLRGRLAVSADAFLRDNKDMLTPDGILPGVYGRETPLLNAADQRTFGYEASLRWTDHAYIGRDLLNYNITASIADHKSHFTRYPIDEEPDLDLAVPHLLYNAGGFASWKGFDLSVLAHGVGARRWQTYEGFKMGSRYWRLKNISTGYTFRLSPDFFVKGLRLGISAENLYFQAQMQGRRPSLDPEWAFIGGNGTLFPRTVLANLSVKF